MLCENFGVVRPGHAAEVRFELLIDACEQMAKRQQAPRLVAGVNTARTRLIARCSLGGFERICKVS